MRLKLDENLDRTAVAIFEAGGHDAQTVRGQGMAGASDRELISACQSEGRCLITLDLDFGNPLLFDPMEYPGIAVIRLPARPSREDILDACHTLVCAFEGANIAGKLWIVQRGRIREYQGGDQS